MRPRYRPQLSSPASAINFALTEFDKFNYDNNSTTRIILLCHDGFGDDHISTTNQSVTNAQSMDVDIFAISGNRKSYLPTLLVYTNGNRYRIFSDDLDRQKFDNQLTTVC